MDTKPISEGQLDRGERACWNVVSGPLRALVPDLRVAQTPDHAEQPCSNPACIRHGSVPGEAGGRLGDADFRAYKGHQARRSLQLLAQKRAAPPGTAVPSGGRDGGVPLARCTEHGIPVMVAGGDCAECVAADLVEAYYAKLAALDYMPVPSETMLADVIRARGA